MFSTVVESLTSYLVSQNGVVSVCIIIGAVFLYLLVRFYRALAPVTAELEKAVELVRAQPAMAQFSSHLQDFSEQFSSFKNLGPLWREFYETLVFPPQGEQDQAIRNTKEVAFCFNETTILAPNLDLPFYAAVPNYLTCFGILGTFVGLVAGIYKASHGLASSDVSELRRALEGLLGGASMAFWTSVVGLTTSLLFSWFEKSRVHGVRRLIARWNDELEQRIKRITHEDLACRQLHELQKQSVFMEEFTTQIAYNIADALGQKLDDRLVPALDRVTHAVEDMRDRRDQMITDIAYNIADALGQKLDDRLVPALDRVTHAVDDMRDHRNQMITDMVGEIVRQFQSTLTAHAGEEIRALCESLQTVRDSLGLVLHEVTEAQKQMKDASEAISTHITESYRNGSEKFSKSMSEVIDTVRTRMGDWGEMLSERLKQVIEQGLGEFERLLGLFSERVRELEQAGQSLQAMMNGTGKMFKELQDRTLEVNDASQRIASALEHCGNVTGRMEKIAEETSRTHGSLQTLSIKLAEGLSQFHQTQETLKAQWQSYCSRFEHVDGSLERVFENLRTGLESFGTNMKTFVMDLDKHTGNITSSLGGAVKELQDAIEELNETLNSRT